MRNTISAHTRNNILTKSETLYESIFIHRKRRINYTMFWPVNGMQQEQPKNPFSASKHRTTKCLLNALSLTRSTLSIYKRHCPMMLPTYLIYCTEHTPAQSHNIRAECIHFVRTVRNIVLCVCIFASVPIPLFFSQGIKLIVAQQQHVHFVFCLWFVYFFCFSHWCWGCNFCACILFSILTFRPMYVLSFIGRLNYVHFVSVYYCISIESPLNRLLSSKCSLAIAFTIRFVK